MLLRGRMMFAHKAVPMLIAGLLAAVSLATPAKANIVYDLTLTQTTGTQTPNPDILVLTFTNANAFVSLTGALDGSTINSTPGSNDSFVFTFSANVLAAITG